MGVGKEGARCIREAVDLGDGMELSAIAAKLKLHSEPFAPINENNDWMAEDFHLDGIFKLALKPENL